MNRILRIYSFDCIKIVPSSIQIFDLRAVFGSILFLFKSISLPPFKSMFLIDQQTLQSVFQITTISFRTEDFRKFHVNGFSKFFNLQFSISVSQKLDLD